MKINKIWAALLAVCLLAALAACGDNALMADDETKFMQGEHIRQADIDCFIIRLDEVNDAEGSYAITAEDVLPALAIMRAELWEADSLGLAMSWAEARQWAEEYYAGLPDSVQQSENGQSIWDWTQGYLARTQMTEEDYLDYLAFNHQVIEAEIALRDMFMEGLSEEERHKEGAEQAFDDYIKGLLDKYRDDLVEPDLQPLLDEVIENVKLWKMN